MTGHQDTVKLSEEGETSLAKAEKECYVGYFKIMQKKAGAIVVNTRKKFSEGHSHVFTMEQGKWLAEMAINKIIPRRCSLRDLESLIRITDNDKYLKKVSELYGVRLQKGKKDYYYNAKWTGGRK